MGSIKLSIHPLFFILGFYYAIFGRIFEFIVYTATAVVHELGHSIVAEKCGYRLDRIVLMPFGAVVKGNISGLKLSDEIKIAFAGPITNLAIGTFFVACWWIFPESYAFTDIAAFANFSTALVNFIPAYPLDGGRIASALLSIKMGNERAFKISKILGIVLSTGLIAWFIASIFFSLNVSLLFFALFVLFGAVSRTKDNVYVKIYSAFSKEKLMRGMAVKRIAIEKRASIKKLMSLLDEYAINEVAVYDNDKQIAFLTQEKLGKIIERAEIYSPIEKYLN